MMQRNPFTPTFGKVPPNMAGRQDILSDMARAFENGPGDPNLSSIIIGPRGSGKTALLSLIADEAQEHGWISARVSAVPGMLDDILERAREAGEHILEPERSSRIKGFGVAQMLEVEFASKPVDAGNWRTRMNKLLDELGQCDIGLLITVDEVRTDLDEMIQLAAIYQHFVQENRKVALVMAGLPYHVAALVDDKSVSFLRRARQHRLTRIGDADIFIAMRKTIVDAGRTIDDGALDVCVTASEGFPYMMQLVGYWTWAGTEGDRMSLVDAQRGVGIARREMEASVYEATYRELSDGDVRFLEAMLADAKESRLSDISARIGVKSNYSTKYKSRLLDRGVIGERGGGYLGFDLPGFRDYLERRLNER